MGTAVHTVLRCAFGGVFSSKVSEGTKRLCPCTLAAYQPLNDIHVMTGFCKKHVGALGSVAPVTSDITVALVYIAYTLAMMNRKDGSQFSLVN